MSARPNDASAKLSHQLPLEMLTLIVEHLMTGIATFWRCRRDFPNLKALRLSCWSFSYIPRLLAILFRGVKLIAVPEHLEHLEKADISKLAPSVQRLTFFPAFQSWTLSYDEFREIVVSQAIERHCNDHREISTSTSSLLYEEDGLSILGWKEAISEDHLAAGYRNYQVLAPKGKESLESDWLLT